MGRIGVACLLALLALCGCGSRRPPAQACIQAQPADVLQALRSAPGHVTLGDGTPLSQCVRRTVDDVRLQALGATLTQAADRLARRMHASDAAALQLGFLIGATARGSAQAAGLQGELANRIAGAAPPDGGPRRALLLRGRAAGRGHG
ncbi:MAG: hypothetical protein JSS99_09730 [Actinobacteria bacterium]|nr:hypothetical protein [Actinomycetota bacterium]